MNTVPQREDSVRSTRTTPGDPWPPVQMRRHGTSSRTRRVLVNLGVAVLVVAIGWLASRGNGSTGYEWDFGVLGDYKKLLFKGLLVTLGLSAVSILLSMVVGLAVWACRVSSIAFVRWVTTGYIEVMRATPLLIQLVWVFYALPIATGLSLSGTNTAVLALTVHGAAYYAEAYRAGIQSVHKEQKEAADILGLSRFQKLRIVVLPQAIRNIIPVLVTQSLIMIKDTTLVSVLGISDFFNAAKTAALTTYRPIEVFTIVGVVYFLIGFPITLVIRHYEVRLAQQTK